MDAPTPPIPTIGRIVNFALQTANGGVEIRPAIIVRVWSLTTVNLQVFCDGDGTSSNDGKPNVVWVTSAIYQERPIGDLPLIGTWHWPHRS